VAVEDIIRRLLTNSRITDFESVAAFRTAIRDQPEAAEVLVRLLDEPQPLGTRARQMLSLFGPMALPAIASGLVRQSADSRSNLLSVAWTVLAAEDRASRPEAAASIVPAVSALFDDRRKLEPLDAGPVEIEYVYRVCDEAYLLLSYAFDANYDEALFRDLDDLERDRAIRDFNRRIDGSAIV
jgi:hypothetical protein